MPGSGHMGNDAIKAKVQSGEVSQDKVDDSALRVLTPMFANNVFDKVNNNTQENNVTTLANNKLAWDLAAQSIVLLKNDGLFPLKPAGPLKIAVIGDQAKSPTVHGGGSGTVVPYYTSTPWAAIRERLGFKPPKPQPSNCSDGHFEAGWASAASPTRPVRAVRRVPRCLG